jgi:hypothetical protein
VWSRRPLQPEMEILRLVELLQGRRPARLCRGGGRRGCAGAATGEVLPGRRPERLEVTSSMEAPAPGRARAGAAADEVVHGMLLLESLIKIC